MTELKLLRAQRDRVLALHRRGLADPLCCHECTLLAQQPVIWPCPTAAIYAPEQYIDWAETIKKARGVRGWSQSQAVGMLRLRSSVRLVGTNSLMRAWKRWEAGDAQPDKFYQALLTELFEIGATR